MNTLLREVTLPVVPTAAARSAAVGTTTSPSAAVGNRTSSAIPTSAPVPAACESVLERLAKSHPCYALGAKPNNKGRIHLPVSPGCNIACRFCERSINRHEQRPGVTAQVIRPHEALGVIREARDCADNLNVVGIAGPGDTLATPYALETFRLVGAEFPELIRCMSTNGLLLPQKAEEIVAAGVETLTVTVNDIDPVRLAQLNDYIIYEGHRYMGKEAAEILIAQQLEGIRRVTVVGVVVKVNTVLVPSVNGEHIGDIARMVALAGASLYNIIPLIPNAKLSDFPAPTCAQIDAARQAAEQHITVFRHCQHCRADAIGIPGGKDYGDRIYLNRIHQTNTFSHG